MCAWLADQLDDENVRNINAASSGDDDEFMLKVCIGHATYGNLEPLRTLFPKIAKFINPSKLRMGQKRPKETVLTVAEIANAFSKRIRAIWRNE